LAVNTGCDALLAAPGQDQAWRGRGGCECGRPHRWPRGL